MKLQKDDRVYIKTKSGGRIAMNNLRPGDWIRILGKLTPHVVIQNSATLGRLEVRWPDGVSNVEHHTRYHTDDLYMGRGKKRWWYDKLPRFLKRYFMPYSKPE